LCKQQWNQRYDWMSTRNDEYYLLCIIDSAQKIVGTGALIVERKFIHQLGLVGHIEDIAVAKDQQGKKLGLRIIQALDFVAEKVGCYKVCSSRSCNCKGDKELIAGRPSWIAQRPTRASTSSAGLSALDWKWRITMDGKQMLRGRDTAECVLSGERRSCK
jgi:GNAT superfamily N-acetyltransferase